MKKIRVLALVMVLSFAALGGAYAMWYDSLFLNTTVKTGSVDVCWTNVKTSDSGGYYADMDGGAGENIWQGNKDSMDVGNPNSGELKNIGTLDAVLSNDSEWSDVRNLDDQLDITLLNGYPGYQEYVEAGITNKGTVPVKFRVITTDVPAWIKVQIELYKNGTGGVNEWTELEGYQLDPGETIQARITYRVEQCAEQGVEANFKVQLKGIQWNEYSADESYVLQYSIVEDRIDG